MRVAHVAPPGAIRWAVVGGTFELVMAFVEADVEGAAKFFADPFGCPKKLLVLLAASRGEMPEGEQHGV